MKTGNTGRCAVPGGSQQPASMEPGHEDREYTLITFRRSSLIMASMEPGHEDREYGKVDYGGYQQDQASMEPGHEDREYTTNQ